MTHETTTTAFPLYPTTLIVGNVLFSGVLLCPGIEPADLPSHSYRNRIAFEAGCSTISTYAFEYLDLCDVGDPAVGTLPPTIVLFTVFVLAVCIFVESDVTLNEGSVFSMTSTRKKTDH